jgi:hypothetical protein
MMTLPANKNAMESQFCAKEGQLVWVCDLRNRATAFLETSAIAKKKQAKCRVDAKNAQNWP